MLTRWMWFSSILLVFALVAVVPVTGFAQSKSEGEAILGEGAPGYHERDGFFLRMSLGSGYYNTEGSSKNGDRADLGDDGPGTSGSLLLGGMVANNLALHGGFYFQGSMYDQNNLRFANSLVGVGMTYYWMPYNIYLTGTVGFAYSAVFKGGSYEDGDWEQDKQYEDIFGFGAALSLGKEWWVSDNWGLGIALEGQYAYTSNDVYELHQGGAMLQFSATFN